MEKMQFSPCFDLVRRDDAGGVAGVDTAHDAKRLICLIKKVGRGSAGF